MFILFSAFHSQVLQRSGFSVVVLPVLSFNFLHLDELYNALSSPQSFSSLILTSPRVVQAMEGALKTDNRLGMLWQRFVFQAVIIISIMCYSLDSQSPGVRLDPFLDSLSPGVRLDPFLDSLSPGVRWIHSLIPCLQGSGWIHSLIPCLQGSGGSIP